MTELTVKIKKLRETAAIPAYATPGSAALDLCCASDQPITLAPGGRTLIPTGIAIAPETDGVVALLCARSGLSTKHGLVLTNGVGVIDADYRGEISVAMANTGTAPYTILPGDRIAQLMFIPVLHAALLPTDDLGETSRGTGGFGSTGNGG